MNEPNAPSTPAASEPPPPAPSESAPPAASEPAPPAASEPAPPVASEPAPPATSAGTSKGTGAGASEGATGTSALSLYLRLALVLLGPLLAVLVVAALPRKFDLWVVNGSERPMRIAVQGREHTLPPRQAALLEGLSARACDLQWALGEDPLSTTRASVTAELFAPRAAWVWNAGRTTARFWIVSRGYGDRVAPPPEPVQVDDLWRLPEGLLPEVDRDLPARVAQGAPGETGAVRRMLWSDPFAQARSPARVTLLVDHRASVPARVRVDGRDVGQVAAQEVLRVEGLAPGRHVLEATVIGPDGGEGQTARREALLEAEPCTPLPAGWVWCPWGEGEFVVVSVGLGQVEEPVPPPERLALPAGSDLFRIPASIEPGLDELPGRTPVARGAKGVVLRSLWTARHAARAAAARPPAAGPTPRTLQEMLDTAPRPDDPAHRGR